MPEDPSIFNLSNAAHKRVLLGYIKSLDGIHRVEVKKVRDQRTLSQNAYMHGVLFVDLAKALTEACGVHVDMHQAKSVAKDKFLRHPIVHPETGEVMAWFTQSTAALDVEECGRFIDQVIQLVELDMGGTVRRPEEYEQQVA